MAAGVLPQQFSWMVRNQIGTGLVAGTSGRKVRIDGEEVRGSESLLDYMRVLWLVPSMDGLFTGPGSDRRRFLDRLTLAIDPTHGRRVSDFENALRQRNRLLDQAAPMPFSTRWNSRSPSSAPPSPSPGQRPSTCSAA